jgi:hypothetical protein
MQPSDNPTIHHILHQNYFTEPSGVPELLLSDAENGIYQSFHRL